MPYYAGLKRTMVETRPRNANVNGRYGTKWPMSTRIPMSIRSKLLCMESLGHLK